MRRCEGENRRNKSSNGCKTNDYRRRPASRFCAAVIFGVCITLATEGTLPAVSAVGADQSPQSLLTATTTTTTVDSDKTTDQSTTDKSVTDKSTTDMSSTNIPPGGIPEEIPENIDEIPDGAVIEKDDKKDEGVTTYSTPSVTDSTTTQLENEYEQKHKILNEKEEAYNNLTEQIAALNLAITRAAIKMDESREELDELDIEIARNEHALANLEEDRDELAKQLRIFIRATYEGRSRMTLLANFLHAGNFTDFLNRTSYTRSVLKKFNEQLKEYEDMTALRKKKTKELNEQKKEAESVKAELEASEEEYKQQVTLLTESISMVEAEVEAAQAEQDAVTDQLREMEEAERKAMEEAKEEDLGEYTLGDITVEDGESYYYDEPYEYTPEDLDLLAGLMEAEAGSASYPGMVAVGSVVMNRIADSRFPNTIPGVVYAPNQFYPAGSGRLAVILARGPSRACYQAAKDVLAGKRNVDKLYFKADWYAAEHGIAGVNIGGNVFH